MVERLDQLARHRLAERYSHGREPHVEGTAPLVSFESASSSFSKLVTVTPTLYAFSKSFTTFGLM